ncbi:protein FAM200A-like [Palaemon carinicauda]|uniref:protein FAM200A-like n=1 Tax=Palaemon carinicauda TaxID=392227 RepID=UPI0035B5F614
MVGIVLGNEMKKNIAQVPLSNSTVQRSISDMATDIKDQVVQEIKSSTFGLFSIQLDESTDVASCSQLMVFARYVHSVQGKTEFPSWLSDEEWIMRLAYVVDIFEQLNKLILQMQGRNTNIIKFIDALRAFITKLENWKRRHLTARENEFKRYFPELSDDESDLVRKPFKLSVEKVPEDCQDEILHLKTDRV